MANELRINDETSLSLYSEKKIEELIKPLQKEIFLTNSYVAGFTAIFEPEEEEFFEEAKLSCSNELVLKREPNEFSEDSIRVYGLSGKPLGYVADKDNEILARLMDAGKKIKAVCKYCLTTDDKETGDVLPYVGIAIYLVDF